ERVRTLERFYRIPGSGVQGSGLGLSIVQRIAARHKARLVLHAGSNGLGLCVKVIFPEHPPGLMRQPRI
ncbi:MAG: ATP-binding protein, partial [Burkholderiales bacterium]